MKIKIKLHKGGQMPLFCSKGDWIDLYTAESVNITGPFLTKNGALKFNDKMISLGISMKIPNGFEAVVAPRSSTYKKHGIILSNHLGVIDSSYSGTFDIWQFHAVALRSTEIDAGTRICQFKIQPSQKAKWYYKLKWLLSSKIEFRVVDKLDNQNRGGYGSTGTKEYTNGNNKQNGNRVLRQKK